VKGAAAVLPEGIGTVAAHGSSVAQKQDLPCPIVYAISALSKALRTVRQFGPFAVVFRGALFSAELDQQLRAFQEVRPEPSS